jgi:hypothetical protein
MSLSSPRFPEVKDTVSASRRHLARPVSQVLVDAVVGEALLVRRVLRNPPGSGANAGMKSLFDALNLVYNEPEKRTFEWLR